MTAPFRSCQEDASAWQDFPFREDDIIISSRAKSGTTWVQFIVALLIFGDQWPAPLHDLSPWLGKAWGDTEETIRLLEKQEHRRFIKTHVPLYALPEKGTRIVVVRDPLDAAVSTYWHRANLAVPGLVMPKLGEWLRIYIRDDKVTDEFTEPLNKTLEGIWYAWEHRNDPGVLLVRYEDLLADREREIRRIGAALGFEASDDAWAWLAGVSSFPNMKRQPQLVPEADKFTDLSRFFRKGVRGDGLMATSAREYRQYRDRVSVLPDDCVKWLMA